MIYAVEVAAYILQHRGRAREVATLVGAVEAVYLRFRLRKETRWLLPHAWSAGVTQAVLGTGPEALASIVDVGFGEDRVAGRSLSLERAADLALRVLDEEMAVAATAGTGGSEAAGGAPSIRSCGGRSQTSRER